MKVSRPGRKLMSPPWMIRPYERRGCSRRDTFTLRVPVSSLGVQAHLGTIRVSPTLAAVHPLFQQPVMPWSLLRAQPLVHSHMFNNGKQQYEPGDNKVYSKQFDCTSCIHLYAILSGTLHHCPLVLRIPVPHLGCQSPTSPMMLKLVQCRCA